MSEHIHVQVHWQRPSFQLHCDLVLPDRGITILYGPSGSGKTTLLRCVAGLEQTFKGRIAIGQDTWFDSELGLNLAVWRRPIGYVFQEASLFDHLSVQQNLNFGLKRNARQTTTRHAEQSLEHCIHLLGIDGLLARRPASLSGGEKQRVAIARALATGPRLLLLDEPMAALDENRRQDIMPWLERLRDELQIPMLYVTHSSQEAARLGDHMVLLHDGRVTQAGPLNNVFTHLADQETGAIFSARVVRKDPQWQLVELAFDEGTIWTADANLTVNQTVRLQIAARDVSISTSMPLNTSAQNLIVCRVLAIDNGREPSHALVALGCGTTRLYALVAHKAVQALGLSVEQTVWAQFKSVGLLA